MKLSSRLLHPASYLVLLLLLWAANSVVAAERRVALLIGNARYLHENKLGNPINDAELLGDVLKNTLKFDEVRIDRNLNVHAMDKVVEDFAKAARGADSVVFYYSGHGIKSPDRRNFLLPIDARTGTGDAPALDRQAVSAEAVRDKLKAAGARVTLLILDACRDGPGAGKSGNKGLARNGGGNGLLVAYATEEDQVAQDGKGRNSPYAEALAQALKRTDLPILEQLDWVADEVHRKEPGQMPTRDGNLRAKAYLVNPPAVQLASKTHPIGQKQANAFGLHDMHGNVWEWVQDWYHDSYSGAPSDGVAWESGGEQNFRVLRGGSWNNKPANLRSANRNNNTGFRFASTAHARAAPPRVAQACSG